MTDNSQADHFFHEGSATRIFPRPIATQANLVSVPDMAGVPVTSYIAPIWGGVQEIRGNYYAVANNGEVDYAVEVEEWIKHYSMLSPGVWIATTVALGHEVRTPVGENQPPTLRVFGVIDDMSPHRIYQGDRAVRMPDDSIYHLRPDVYKDLYLSESEVIEYGLRAMDQDTFEKWAIGQFEPAALIS